MTPLGVLRKQKLMTQRELAAAGCVTMATVSNAETGKMRPKILTIHKISRALGMQPKDVDEFRRELDLPS